MTSLEQKGLVKFRDDKGVYKYGIQFFVGNTTTWPYCKIKLSWKNEAPAEPRDIRSHGCLDSMSSEYLAGTVLDENGVPIQNSKVIVGTRQLVLNSFNGTVRGTQFNIHLKMADAID